MRPGRPPREVAELTRLEVVGLRQGSTVLEFALAEDARPLDELDLGVEALEAYEAGVVEVAEGRTPPAPWDDGVARTLEQLTRVFDRGIDEIVVATPSADPDRVAVFRKEGRASFRVAGSAGVRERVEIEGRLLMADFAATRDEARIHRPLDPPVRCTFGPELEVTVLRLLRRYVRATGWAELDDRGRVGLLELENLEDAEIADGRSFWDLPTLDELAEEQGIEPVERLEDLVSDFWPEDEDVDEFLAAIESRD